MPGVVYRLWFDPRRRRRQSAAVSISARKSLFVPSSDAEVSLWKASGLLITLRPITFTLMAVLQRAVLSSAELGPRLSLSLPP